MSIARGGGAGPNCQRKLQRETIEGQPSARLPGGWVVWRTGQALSLPSGREKKRRLRVLVVTTCWPGRGRQAPPRLSTSREKVPTNWLAIMSHHGECDIDPKRTKQTSGSQQPGRRAHDLGPGSRVDGSNFPRHTRRILAAYRERGAAALAHGHRGRRPVNATPEALVDDVAHLARTRYAGDHHDGAAAGAGLGEAVQAGVGHGA